MHMPSTVRLRLMALASLALMPARAQSTLHLPDPHRVQGKTWPALCHSGLGQVGNNDYAWTTIIPDVPASSPDPTSASQRSDVYVSNRVAPVDIDFFRRSLPARSTMYSRPTLAFMDTLSADGDGPAPAITRRLATVSSTSACERLECAFNLVKAYILYIAQNH